ncbi:exonuclease SbcCD subunit D [Oceanobacillus jeddahense]|uniref:Nuclease SbcCD subunit D n=1 Tax=Oceanobacillus jeddahense TaxID=1462527 RepID=A0ABY5JNF8_9BACI|nr:exonuclease SbcCD subunit D [Oceanobacillus jeddahense]UUI01845.1 exonuclease SbcCD subunit D [Oceanobacillus jeddahense]
MRLIHTADWHLGKLVQGVYMTEDQAFILDQFIKAVEKESPDAVIIAGDLYDRAVPPVEAVDLLDKTLDRIINQLGIPVLAIAGNHDSPGRLHFGSRLMKEKGYHIIGQLSDRLNPVVLSDEFGEVHFHLIPYADPSVVKALFQEEDIRNHQEANAYLVNRIKENLDEDARHVYIGHAFVTPFGEIEENTSDSERPLSIGGAEHVDAHLFKDFHYTALGHLHQAHHVLDKKIRYSGSILKYSLSEEHHQKGYLVVELDEKGDIQVEKKKLSPKREMRSLKMKMEDIYKQPRSEDYVFVQLLDELPILSPMEKVRSIFPNAMHVERIRTISGINNSKENQAPKTSLSEMELFDAFYQEVTDKKASEEMNEIMKELFQEIQDVSSERKTSK